MIRWQRQYHEERDRVLTTTSTSVNRGVEFAWKTHSAIADWTAKVDSKAAIILSMGGVLLGFLVTLSSGARLLAGLTGWRLAGLELRPPES
jgi:hypothetical protein